jgi:protease-4
MTATAQRPAHEELSMRLLRGLWKLLVGVKDAFVLLFMLLFFGVLYAALSFSPNPVAAGNGGALLVDLNGSIVEQPHEIDTLNLLTGNSPATGEYRLRDIVRALQAAATDNRIKVVALDLDSFTGGGQALLAEVGAAIDGVKRANKPVVAFATGYTDGGYQLAAHASEVWLDPLGAVLVTGPGSSHLYYKGLLDKLGVTTHVYRVGQFKSAVEPFIRSDQSPEAKAANQALADALWQTWRDDVGKARPRAKIAPYFTDPQAAIAAAKGDIAQSAVQAGLVDRLGDHTAFSRRIAELAGAGKTTRADDFRRTTLEQWLSAHPESDSGGNIGVVTIAGDIVDGKAGPGTAGGETISHLILDELTKNRIKALVVRVDSPGGSVSAAEKIRSAILEAKAKRLPIVVSMASVAASGGYWVSTPADRIFAEPSTITGSIGVFGLLPSFEGSLAKLGLSADGVKTTPLSGEPDLYKGPSPQFNALMQIGVENIYQRFTGLVAQSRKLPIARVDEIAQGRVWAGGAAHQIGLVDQFGTLDDAVAYAAHAAGIDPSTAKPIFIERERNPLKTFLRNVASPSRDNDSGDDAWSRVAARPDQILAQAINDALRIASGPGIQVRCLECEGAPQPGSSRHSLMAIILEKLLP